MILHVSIHNNIMQPIAKRHRCVGRRLWAPEMVFCSWNRYIYIKHEQKKVNIRTT